MTEDTLIEAAAEELATVIGALLDTTGTAAAAPQDAAGSGSAVVVRLTLTGTAAATLCVGLDAADAVRLARLVMGDDEDPPASAVSDNLQELCGQAIGALSQRDGFEGLRMTEVGVGSAPSGETRLKRLSAGDRFEAVVSFWADIPRSAAAGQSGAAIPPNLELILDIDLPLTVRFGETEMTLQALTHLAPGSVIDLGRAPDDPVDVLVNGRLVARGEVVVVSGNYGVRIIEVVSPADRLRTVAA